MATVPLLSDQDAAPEARAVFDAIRATRGTDYVNNFWRALAHDPPLLRATWERLATVMAPGALDPWWNALPYPRAKRWWLQWPDALPAGDDAAFTGARTAVPERR